MEKIQEYLRSILKEEDKITKILTILTMLLPLMSLGMSLLEVYRKLNFKVYYGLSPDLVNFDTTELFQNLIAILIIFLLLLGVEKITKILDKTKKVEYVLMIILLIYVGVVFGVLSYVIGLNYATFLGPNFLKKKILELSEKFYTGLCIISILINSIVFIVHGINNSKHKIFLKICKSIIIIEVTLLIIYNVKDMINLYEYKRDYEVIIVDNKLKVILYKNAERVFTVNGEYKPEEETLILNTKKIESLSYERMEESKLAIEYRKFLKVEVKK